MTVVAGGNEELTVWVDESTRDLVNSSLGAHFTAVADGLSYQSGDVGRARQERRLERIAELRCKLDDSSGPVALTGSTSLIVEIVRDAAGQATYDLDSLVDDISATPARLARSAVAELRDRMHAVTACLEALIACEDSRGRA